jgi:hypothetical protein
VEYAKTALILGITPGEVHSIVLRLKDEGEIQVLMVAMDRAMGVRLR